MERGRPRLPVSDVVATLQFFLREGVQWRALPASNGRASGSTLRRRLREWRATAVLPRAHAVLLRLARSDPEMAAGAIDLIVDSCSVRAKHGGELTGPNPTDRGKRGTKYHLVVAADGLPLGAVASAANVHDTKMFPELLRLALVIGAKIARLFADAGYHSAGPLGNAGGGTTAGSVCARASSPASARLTLSTAPASASSAPSSRTPTPGSSTTSVLIDAMIAQRELFSPCSSPP